MLADSICLVNSSYCLLGVPYAAEGNYSLRRFLSIFHSVSSLSAQLIIMLQPCMIDTGYRRSCLRSTESTRTHVEKKLTCQLPIGILAIRLGERRTTIEGQTGQMKFVPK